MSRKTVEIAPWQASVLSAKIQVYNLALKEAQEALSLITAGHGLDACTFVSLDGTKLTVDTVTEVTSAKRTRGNHRK